MGNFHAYFRVQPKKLLNIRKAFMKIKKLVTYLAISFATMGLLACNSGSGSSGNSGGGQNNETPRYNFTVDNQSQYDLKIYNGMTSDSHVVSAHTSQNLSLLSSNVYTIQYQYTGGTDSLGSINRDANNGNITISISQSSAPTAATWYANNVTVGGRNFGSTLIANWPKAPSIPGCVNTPYEADCTGNGNSASVTFKAEAPTPSKAVISNKGNWNPNISYDVVWSPPPVTYPVVQYNGQSYVACSFVSAGAVPGSATWNAWELYQGNGSNCGGAI